MSKTIKYHRGSEWRKWDLHIHAPLDKLNDGYKTGSGIDPLDKFCNEIENSEVQIFGITNYFSSDSFTAFIDRFNKKYPKSKKRFFFNLELRLNETVNKKLEEVNTHLLFNPASFDKVPKFLSFLKVVKTGKDETPIMCSELKSEEDFKAATVTRKSISEAFENTFGPKSIRQDHFLIVTAANNDGLRPESGKKRKESICDEIDKFSDAFFGGSQNVKYYLDIDRYEGDIKAPKKPVIAGSDSHSFEDISNFLGRRFTQEVEESGKKIERIIKDVIWVKADPTYEGLKQLLYEPESGERVYVGAVKPDQKDDYKVIRKIKFAKSNDFPNEIEFNDNLCSVIGSRSSGKSALLAYIGHSIDPETVEKITLGPGKGEEFHWNKIKSVYSIEWANGQSNENSPGRIIYIPQNYLFDKSEDPKEVKQRIKPVLFKVLPDFKNRYLQAETSIEGLNNQISDQVDEWCNASDQIKLIIDKLKKLGDKKAIERQQKTTDEKIQQLKNKYKLSETDIKNYQKISEQISTLNNRINEIEIELGSITNVSATKNFFTTGKITLTPSLSSLPEKLQGLIKSDIQVTQQGILVEANKKVLEYKNKLADEKIDQTSQITKIKTDNKVLIEKYQKNAELEVLVNALNGHVENLNKIGKLESNKASKEKELKSSEKIIADSLISRDQLINGLLKDIEKADQTSLPTINFGIEYGLDKEKLKHLSERINIRDKTDFVEKNELKINTLREKSAQFIADIFSGAQKVIAHNDKKDVLKEALQLTENVLFTAEMEGDKIGGFSEPTMTPGKRALFALRLILAQSDDTWPLLIDQPEDDLDSRSIYDEVVPFLKRKKKERQIIMVSHNANLVMGSDSEQLIITNRHGNDRKNEDGKQFNYLTGSLEFTEEYDKDCKDTLNAQGTCEHACSILDGGKLAFESRKNKYQIR